MIRTYLLWFGLAILAQFFASCNCGVRDRALTDEDASNAESSNVDASNVNASNVDASNIDSSIDGISDSGQVYDVWSIDSDNSLCPPKEPAEGTPCSGNASCIYEPFEGCHWDCTLECPSECGGITGYMGPCDSFQYQCKNDSWASVVISAGGCNRTPETDCICVDDAGFDDNAGN
jgi:hypothetical protein